MRHPGGDAELVFGNASLVMTGQVQMGDVNLRISSLHLLAIMQSRIPGTLTFFFFFRDQKALHDQLNFNLSLEFFGLAVLYVHSFGGRRALRSRLRRKYSLDGRTWPRKCPLRSLRNMFFQGSAL